MSSKKLNRLFFTTILATYIPTIVYVLAPGVAGIPGMIQAALLIFVFLKIRDTQEYKQIKCDRYLKLFYAVLFLGLLIPLFVGIPSANFKYYISNNVSILTIFLLTFFVLDISCIKYFAKNLLLIVIPVAILSFLTWTGFEKFDLPHIIAPLGLCVLLSPFLKRKFSYIFIALIIGVSLYDYSVRDCLLGAVLSVGCYIAYKCLNTTQFDKYSKVLSFALLLLPIIFLLASLLYDFNIFEYMETIDIGNSIGPGRKSDDRTFNVDSRTSVYIDVLMSIDGWQSIVFGHGTAYALPSLWTEDRFSVEAGILNVFIRYGLIGCFSVFFLLSRAVYLGLNKTNNSLTKLVAIFVAFKFLFLFISEADFNVATVFAIGICLSNTVRRSTDKEIMYQLNN